MKKPLVYIIINFAVLSTLIVGMEVTGQILYYLTHGRFVYQIPAPVYNYRANDPNYYHYQSLFEMHPLLVVRPKKNLQIKDYMSDKTITTTDRNTRWTGSPKDDGNLIKVAALGGSTTFGTGVTDSDTWPALLQTKLGDRFSVINYGIPCYSTAETIVQTALVVPESKPDFIIYYQGWNDIVLYHETDFSPDYYSHGMKIQDCVQIPKETKKAFFDKLNELSAIARLASVIGSKIPHHSNPDSCTTYDTPDPVVDRIYVRNLDTLKILSERIASYTLFVPQVLNYQWFIEKGKSKTYYDCWSKIKNSSMPLLMDRFNVLMQSVCSNHDPKCIYVDGVLNVNWSPEDFVDDGHFTRQGGEKFVEIISQMILSRTKELKLHYHNKLDMKLDRNK